MFSFRRFLAITRKEFLHVLRDWRSLVMAVAIPIMLVLIFGYALSLDLRNVPTVVWDQSKTQASREFLSLLRGSAYFDVRTCEGYDPIVRDLTRGRAVLGMVIPGDFAQAVASGREVAIQVVADGSDANTARLALNYAEAVGQIFNQNVTLRRAELAGRHVAPAVRLDGRTFFNQDMRSQNSIIPGIIAVVMVVIAAMLTSVTVAREWETGTMEQLISTPVRVPELVLGKVAPHFVVGMFDVAISVAMGQWIYDVPIRGNAGLLFAMAAIFLTGALFFGLLISINLKKQVLANQAALIGSYMPTLIISGFVFAIANMPRPIQLLSYIIPARYFITILRGIYLKGIGLEILWLNALLLSLYAAIMIALCHKRMKLKLE
ncbi:MAG: ABC transporter permease [Desulfovibrio sp.]|uniref:ABC transporter permease n=1 Tax=Desulfovibrio sp. 7SRBS1 TaxID=3378064 RepID=UPI003B400F8E